MPAGRGYVGSQTGITAPNHLWNAIWTVSAQDPTICEERWLKFCAGAQDFLVFSSMANSSAANRPNSSIEVGMRNIFWWFRMICHAIHLGFSSRFDISISQSLSVQPSIYPSLSTHPPTCTPISQSIIWQTHGKPYFLVASQCASGSKSLMFVIPTPLIGNPYNGYI